MDVQQQQSHSSFFQVGLALALLVSVCAVEEVECIVLWRHALALACSSAAVSLAGLAFCLLEVLHTSAK